MVNDLIDRCPRRLLHVTQLRDSVQSISANIAEAFGRGKGRDRAHPLEIARGEAEEAIQHLGANFRSNRIPPADYWPVHNLLVVIVKMLNSLLNH
jgi:four helix bundle protein